MTATTAIPSPLFDGLREMLADENYKPSLTGKAQQDYAHAKQFLLSYRGSLDTFNSYRREIERFLQWCQLIAHKHLTEIKREDFEAFLSFCEKPPKTWISLKIEHRFLENQGERVPNPNWRPFVVKIAKVQTKAGLTPDATHYALSEKAIKVIFATISSFYQYLIQENYANFNPVAIIRQKNRYTRKQVSAPIVRRLSELQWGYVIETAEMMAKEAPEEHARTLFMMNCLYGLYLRISELTANARWTPTMGDFFRDSLGRWWFITVGKGNKERQISVSNEMLEALKKYRQALGLPPLPSPQEKAPLFANSHDGKALKSTRYIRELVQHCFDKAVLRLHEDNQAEEALQLSTATVHWLRHTGISDDVKIRPREHVRDDAGHSSSSITDKYIDIELQARHDSAKKKRLKPEFIED